MPHPQYTDPFDANRTSSLARGDREWRLDEAHNAQCFAAYVYPSVQATTVLEGLGGRGQTAALRASRSWVLTAGEGHFRFDYLMMIPPPKYAEIFKIEISPTLLAAVIDVLSVHCLPAGEPTDEGGLLTYNPYGIRPARVLQRCPVISLSPPSHAPSPVTNPRKPTGMVAGELDNTPWPLIGRIPLPPSSLSRRQGASGACV